MADTKISALTSATTPLAGTEVLPIVQSSTTKQVSVANLTAGRAISATQLTLTAGNLIVANGYGVDFSATPGTGTSELLADYEEGTFTPYLNADSGGQLPGATTGSGKYVKVGSVVTITGSVTWNSFVTGYSGAARIYGFPYSPADVGTVPKGFNGFSTASYDSYQLQTSARLDPSVGGSAGVVNISNFSAGGTMYFNFSYRV